MAVVACRVDRQIDAILHLNHPRVRVHRARVLQLPVQVLHAHPVRIAMAPHPAVVPQVVVTRPIAAHIQVDHQHHVVTHRVQVQIVQPVAHTATEIPVQVRVRRLIVRRLIVRRPVRHQIVANVALRVDRQIDAMLVHQLGVQMNAGPSVHAIHVQVPIVQQAVHMVTATHVRVHVHLQIVHAVARRVDRKIDAMIVIMDREIHEHQQTNPAEATHTVAIVHALAMTVTPVRLRVTANVEADQIVPEVASPMIAKSVHAVALAKSA